MSEETFTVEEIETRCQGLGVSVNALCREANINRSVLVRWKKQPPKSFQLLKQINSTLNQLEIKRTEEILQTPVDRVREDAQ